MSVESSAARLVEEFRARPTLRAGSLITTVFGDAIAPRGGSVWVGSLIRVMQDFGISERLTRTSVFRLAADGWLTARSVGRRSYYGLTGEGAARFAQATQRIYGEPRQRWDGTWCLLLLAGAAGPARDELRKELAWQGFGAVGGSVMAHPSPNRTELSLCLERLGAGAEAVALEGRCMIDGGDQRLRALAADAWNLDDIDRRYEQFLDRFRPVYRSLERAGAVAPRRAFQIRTLLIQEYRKILLRDPLLPTELLPDGWHGLAAYQLCRNLYRAVHRAADEFLSASMETADGPLPPPAPEFYDRFGGLT